MVHETHGLGIYRGIEKVEMEGVVKDYIKIEYRDGGNLYVLVNYTALFGTRNVLKRLEGEK